MKALTAAAAALLAAAVLTGTAVSASTATTSTVSIVSCLFNHGGSITVPAGSEVDFRTGWLSKKDGNTMQFLRSVVTTASVDGNPVADANSYWSAPVDNTNGSLTTWLYSTGITLGAGDSLTLNFDFGVTHTITDGFKGDRYSGDLVNGTCTVTGV